MSFNDWILLLILSGIGLNELNAQNDTIPKQLEFNGDFRFRVEHDWNSRKPDGTFRLDRSRLRYRFRFGVNFRLNQKYAFGGRLRTGNINDQQGPHVTIGGNSGEFGLTQIGLEKLYFKFKAQWIDGWLGKNDAPFEKQNELFWNDNVFPEGVAINLNWKAAHFINSFQIKT
ncbi:MAG: putative porin, partial [Bacteroidota bacterium]